MNKLLIKIKNMPEGYGNIYSEVGRDRDEKIQREAERKADKNIKERERKEFLDGTAPYLKKDQERAAEDSRKRKEFNALQESVGEEEIDGLIDEHLVLKIDEEEIPIRGTANTLLDKLGSNRDIADKFRHDIDNLKIRLSDLNKTARTSLMHDGTRPGQPAFNEDLRDAFIDSAQQLAYDLYQLASKIDQSTQRNGRKDFPDIQALNALTRADIVEEKKSE